MKGNNGLGKMIRDKIKYSGKTKTVRHNKEFLCVPVEWFHVTKGTK